MVYLLAERRERGRGDVRKPSSPDGGLDAVLWEPGADGACLRGWQAKNFPAPLKTASWRACKASLERAIEEYDPPHVTFVFPRDLNHKETERFQRELRDPHPGRVIDWWGRAEVEDALNDTDDGRRIARRFLDEPGADLETFGRLLPLGGPVDSAGQALLRQEALGDVTGRDDPYFTYPIGHHGAGLSPGASPPGSIARFARRSGSAWVTIDAVPRNDEALRRFAGEVSFPDDATAAAARRAMRDRGEIVVSGDQVTMTNAPPFMQGDIDRMLADPSARVAFRYGGEPTPVGIVVETDRGSLSTEMRLNLLPPTPEGAGGVRLVRDTLELVFRWTRRGDGGTKVTYTWTLEPSSAPLRERLLVLEFLTAFTGAGRLTLSGEGGERLASTRLEPQPLIEEVSATRDILAALALVSDWTLQADGTAADLKIPSELSEFEVFELASIAAMVRDGALKLRWERLGLDPATLSAPLPEGPQELEYRGAWPLRVARQERRFLATAQLRAVATLAEGEIVLMPADADAADLTLTLRRPEG